jgi:hypothetical protein
MKPKRHDFGIPGHVVLETVEHGGVNLACECGRWRVANFQRADIHHLIQSRLNPYLAVTPEGYDESVRIRAVKVGGMIVPVL